VTLEYNVTDNPKSPVWKCIGTVDSLSVVQDGQS
jgi:hypothetical protein